MLPLDPTERIAVVAASPFAGLYEKAIDRESAHEILQARAAKAPLMNKAPKPQPRGRQSDDMVSAMTKSAARSIGSNIGRQVARGVLGALFGGKR